MINSDVCSKDINDVTKYPFKCANYGEYFFCFTVREFKITKTFTMKDFPRILPRKAFICNIILYKSNIYKMNEEQESLALSETH